jgi:hypothetical protein
MRSGSRVKARRQSDPTLPAWLCPINIDRARFADLTKTLQMDCSFITRSVFSLICNASGSVLCSQNLRGLEAFPRGTRMHTPELIYLFVIPFGLAIGFMVWVFWNLTKQIGRR